MSQYRLSSDMIPLFRFLPKSVLEQVKSLSKFKELNHGEILMLEGKKVVSLYLILDGTLGVYTKDFGENIALLKVGATIGEMSFIDITGCASASVKVEAGGAKVIEFPFSIIQKVILDDPFLSQCFYKGMALLLSQRLRSTNKMVRIRVSEIRNTVQGMIDDNDLLRHVASTQKSLENLGLNINHSLTDILTMAEKLQNTDQDKTQKDLIEKLQSGLKKVISVDLQVVDRITHKIDALLRCLEKIEKTLNRQPWQEGHGDTSLFTIQNESA